MVSFFQKLCVLQDVYFLFYQLILNTEFGLCMEHCLEKTTRTLLSLVYLWIDWQKLFCDFHNSSYFVIFVNYHMIIIPTKWHDYKA